MSAIQFSDLADYADIIGSIKKLAQANIDYGDSAEATNDRIKASIAELQKETDKYYQTVLSGKKNLNSVASDVLDLAKANGSLNAQLKQNQAVVDSNNRVIQSMRERLAELEKKYNSLGDTEKKDVARKKEISRELVSTTRAVNGLAKATEGSGRSIKAAEGSYDALKQSAAELKKQLSGMPDAYDKGTGKINEQNKAAVELNQQYLKQLKLLGLIEKSQGLHTRNVGNYPKPGGGGVGGMLGSLPGMSGLGSLGSVAGIAGAAAGVASVIASAGAAVLEVGQQYEKLNLLTENALNNNKAAAQEANALIKHFADNSPAELETVTEAFNRLVGIGIVPTEDELKQLSDVAIAKNKTVMDYVEAIADAQHGEFERLKEFGIDASKAGDKVIFTYNGLRTTVDNNSTAINNYLIGLGKVPGIMGATDKLAQSFSGRMSTMWDGIKGIANDIFQLFLPAINAVAGVLGKAVGFVGTMTSGLRAMAKEQGLATTLFKLATGPAQALGEAYGAGKLAQEAQAKAVTKALDVLRKQADAQAKLNDQKRKQADADAKYAKEADKRLSDALANSKAGSDTKLSGLSDDKQDGLISEREFINRRQKITLDGIAQRQALLAKAGKKETDEYKRLATEKIAIESLTKRDLLKLNLSDSKNDASSAVADIGKQKEQGILTDAEYNERKRAILTASLTEQRSILEKAGQGNSQLAKDLATQQLKVDSDYFEERVKIAKEGWKKELELTKDDLRLIDQQTAKIMRMSWSRSSSSTMRNGPLSGGR